MTNFDKHNNLCFACAIAKISDSVLNTQRSITQTSNETNWFSFDESFAGCLGNIIKLSKYFLSHCFLSKYRYF